MENFIKMQECFGVACSLVRYTLSLGSDRGTQSLLGIVEEEKKETKSGMKSCPFSWAWIGKRGKKWARKLDQRLERFTILRAKLGCDALFTLISGHFQFMVKMSCR